MVRGPGAANGGAAPDPQVKFASIKSSGREHGTRHKQADRERYQLPALSNFVGFLETRVHSANALDIVMMAGP